VVQALWRLREEITPSLLDDGHCYKYDVSLPLSDYYDLVEVMRDRLKSVTTRVVAYGHIGDGQCRHLNVMQLNSFDALMCDGTYILQDIGD